MLSSAFQLLMLMGFLIPFERTISYIERKLEADMQARVGPSLTGRSGTVQTLADFFKLIQKTENPNLNQTEAAWFYVQVVILFSSLALVPLGPGFPLVDSQLAIFLPIIALFFHGIAGAFLGVNEGSFQKTISSMRRSAQMIAALLPVMLILLTEGLLKKGFSWSVILVNASETLFGKTLFFNPIHWISFFVFLLSGVAYLSISPMNSDCSRTDVAGGSQAFFTGQNRVIFDFSQFYLKFIWAALAVSVFLGGYRLPDRLVRVLSLDGQSYFKSTLEWAYSFGKISILLVGASLLAKVSPRYRADQVTDFAWKILSPISLLCLIASILWTMGMDH